MVDLEATLRSSLDGRYDIEHEIGRGGMSVVFRAHDVKHNRTVAVKAIRPELSRQIGAERFQREIEVVAGLTHPHILPLHDSGEASGLLYYVMPYIEGGSLRSRMESEGALPEADAIRIVGEIADALGYAHEHDVVHRNVKPGNILLAGNHALLADFGIAHLASGDRETLTLAGLALGTPAYLSPEQASGEKDIDGRSDIYSLGCVLYEALSGSPPFSEDSIRAMLLHQMVDTPVSVRSLNDRVSQVAERIVEAAIRKEPSERFQTGEQMAQALELASGSRYGGIQTRILRRLGVPRRHVDRARMAMAASAAALAVLLLFAVWIRERGAGDSLRADVRYVVVDRVSDDASDAERRLSRDAARGLRIMLSDWESVSVVPEAAMDGPTAELTVAGMPQSSFILGSNLARRFGADFLVQVQAFELGRVNRLAPGGIEGDVRIEAVRRKPEDGAVTDDFVASGPVDSLELLMTDIAMQLLELDGEPADYGVLLHRSQDHRSVQDFEEGRKALRSWRLAEAQRLFEASIARDPSFALAHHYLAQTMYWRLERDAERLRELGPLIDYHSTQADREGTDKRLRPRERDEVNAFSAFWAGDYDLARARYDSLISFESADIESIVLRGAVEVEDPILEVREDGIPLPRQNLNVARAMFDTAIALSPRWELSWGHMHDIDRKVAESAYKGTTYGFELPGEQLVRPYEIRDVAEQQWFCLTVKADTLAWDPRSPSDCPGDLVSKSAAAAMQSRTVERLDRATQVERDPARAHQELAQFLMWERSLPRCDADPVHTDSLAEMARRHGERALAIRKDTTPQDRVMLASLYLGTGNLESAITATNRALDELRGGMSDMSEQITPPPIGAANPYLAAGRAHPAVEILELVWGDNTSRLFDPQDPERSIDSNGMDATLKALLALGTLGETGSDVTDRIELLKRAWSDPQLSERDRVALRLASLSYVGPALANSRGEWKEWFDGWNQYGLDVPPVWQGMLAMEESPPDLVTARARLDEAVENLSAFPANRPVSAEELYLPLVLAERTGATVIEEELRRRLSRCALRLDEFDPGWGMWSSLGLID